MSKPNFQKFIPPNVNAKLFGNLVSYEIETKDLIKTCATLYRQHKLPLKIITAFDERGKGGAFKIMYVFGVPKDNFFIAPYIMVQNEFPSLTPTMHEASVYERKIMTFFGLKPVGHPDPRTLILHENWPNDAFPLRKDYAWNNRPAMAKNEYKFNKINGEGIYEIPVGPVHAGIIEPGHFRFSVAG